LRESLHLLGNQGETILQGGSRGSIFCRPQMLSEWRLFFSKAYRWPRTITNMRQPREAAGRVSYLMNLFADP